MTIYTVIERGPAPSLQEKIAEHYHEAYISVVPGVWFISDKGRTTQEIGELLGFTKDGGNQGVLISVAGYAGFTATGLWDWLKVKSAAP